MIKYSARFYTLLAGISLFLLSFAVKHKPTLYLVGDSTVAGGWGKFMDQYFDTTALSVQNRAVPGTSTRTYYTKGVHDKTLAANGMWEGVMQQLKAGDYIMIQFGHNDDSPILDSTRCRGSLKGIGNDTVSVFNPFLNRTEVVHSYGWYLNRFIAEAKSKDATVIICSPIPKNKWKEGKVVRNNELYGKWSREVATNSGVAFLDLNNTIADKYDEEGEAKVNSYFTDDKVHTNTAGSQLNTSVVVNWIGNTKTLHLGNFLK